MLTPLSVDPAHPFPYISSLSLNLAVLVRDPGVGADGASPASRCRRCCRGSIALPDGERFVPIEAGHRRAPGPRCSPGWRSASTTSFRVTRNADLELDEDEARTCWRRSRRFCSAAGAARAAVRLEIERTCPRACSRLLSRELDLEDDRRLREQRSARSGGLWSCIASLDRPDLQATTPWTPVTAPALVPSGDPPQDIFADAPPRRRAGAPPVRVVRDVGGGVHRAGRARTRDVLAIKQTLYRTSGDSPIVPALERAAAARQAGGGARRAQGALRRGGQHRLGAHAGGGGRPRRLRRGRPEDPRQGLPRGAARRPTASAATRTSAPGNYNSDDRAPLRGPGPAHRRPAICADVADLFNLPDRLQPAARPTGKLLVAPLTLRASACSS